MEFYYKNLKVFSIWTFIIWFSTEIYQEVPTEISADHMKGGKNQSWLWCRVTQ